MPSNKHCSHITDQQFVDDAKVGLESCSEVRVSCLASVAFLEELQTVSNSATVVEG